MNDLIKLVEVSNSRTHLALLDKFYYGIYIPEFPDPDECESLENMIQYLHLKANGWYGRNNYHIILIMQDERPIAGSISDYLAEANTGVIEFLLVAPAFRSSGIASQLLDFTEATLIADAKNLLNRELDLIVGEMNDPFKIANMADNVDPFVRAKIWGKWGYLKINFPYIQPALSTDQDPVYYLLLIGKVINTDFDKKIPVSLIKLIIHEYMKWAMRIENPEQNSEYEIMRRYLDTVENVSVTPLTDYVGYDVTKPFIAQEITVVDDPALEEVLQVYKNSFGEGPVTASANDFIIMLSKASSKNPVFNFHLWGLRPELNLPFEGMASFFTFECVGFGGYLALNGTLKGSGRLRLLLARIEEQMIKDGKNCHGWFIECEPKGQELIFEHLGFHEIAITYRQPPIAGQPLYDLTDTPELRLLYKEFGCQYKEPKLSCEAFLNSVDRIFRTVYFIANPKDSIFFQDMQQQVLRFKDGFLCFRHS